MAQLISGPGVNLPYPQNLYPSELQNAPQDPSSNRLALAPGESFVLPAGDWYVNLGLYNVLQFHFICGLIPANARMVEDLNHGKHTVI